MSALSRCVALVAVGCLVIAGCGGDGGTKKGTKVKGKLLSGDKPLEVRELGQGGAAVKVNIGLIREDGSSGGGASADAQGNFTMENVPAGTYTLTVEHFDQGLTMGGKGPGGMGPGGGGPPGGPAGMKQKQGGANVLDRLQGKFSQANSEIKVTITEQAEQDLGTIDLEKKETWPGKK